MANTLQHLEEEIKILSPRLLYYTRERQSFLFDRAWTLHSIRNLSTTGEDGAGYVVGYEMVFMGRLPSMDEEGSTELCCEEIVTITLVPVNLSTKPVSTRKHLAPRSQPPSQSRVHFCRNEIPQV